MDTSPDAWLALFTRHGHERDELENRVKTGELGFWEAVKLAGHLTVDQKVEMSEFTRARMAAAEAERRR